MAGNCIPKKIQLDFNLIKIKHYVLNGLNCNLLGIKSCYY